MFTTKLEIDFAASGDVTNMTLGFKTVNGETYEVLDPKPEPDLTEEAKTELHTLSFVNSGHKGNLRIGFNSPDKVKIEFRGKLRVEAKFLKDALEDIGGHPDLSQSETESVTKLIQQAAAISDKYYQEGETLAKGRSEVRNEPNPEFFTGDQKIYWISGQDDAMRELTQLAAGEIRNLALQNPDKPLSYEEIETHLSKYPETVSKLNNQKVERPHFYEIAQAENIPLDQDSQDIFNEAEQTFRRILQGESTDDVEVSMDLKSLHRRSVVAVLKWLANTAELSESTHPFERARAREFLDTFTDVFFSRLGGKEVFDTFADMIEKRVARTMKDQQIPVPEIVIVPVLTGADLTGRYVKERLKEKGVRFQPLLLNHAMMHAMGRRVVGENHQLTEEGKEQVLAYLRQEKLIAEGVRSVIFIDLGRTGTFHELLKPVFKESEVLSDLLVINHSGYSIYSNSSKFMAQGLNDGAWSKRFGEGQWFGAVLDNGFEAGLEAPFYQVLSESGTLSTPTRPTPRPWFHELAIKKFEKYAALSVQWESRLSLQKQLSADIKGFMHDVSLMKVTQAVKIIKGELQEQVNEAAVASAFTAMEKLIVNLAIPSVGYWGEGEAPYVKEFKESFRDVKGFEFKEQFVQGWILRYPGIEGLRQAAADITEVFGEHESELMEAVDQATARLQELGLNQEKERLLS
ncbi:MAG TPA: hypothetical protein VJC08_05060, partial [bacterium]|nr:hypothetical protein [bacterium]